jgi:glycosyltransferase involved in cell wall biosynthesis
MASPAVQGASSNVVSVFSPCLLIPVYNHGRELEATIAEVASTGIACIVIDDGSDQACRKVIDDIDAAHPWIEVLHRPENGGKGAAVKDGLRLAQRLGYSHALQIDADRQHDCADIRCFLREAQLHPNAFVIGAARFNDSVPTIRRLARELTHFWVRVNTLSHDILDSMCGFRVYPLALVTSLLNSESMGDHMEFDMEVLVRAHWRGCAFVNLPTNVVYPAVGVSHFRLFRDNLLISRTHAKLFFGMLIRLPSLLRRRAHTAVHP